jgi:Rps23 Pro-64 3,4-dihydroxylase Tpa1-like proline 4-hydroxylase
LKILIKKMIRGIKPVKAETPDSGYTTLVDFDRLTSLFVEKREEYERNHPFPHIVIDDFLPSHVIKKLLQQYPLDHDNWIDSPPNAIAVQKEKRHIRDLIEMPRIYRELITELGCHRFLVALSRLSGIPAIMSDPDLLGAGIHQSSRGAHLKIHADFSIHRRFGLDRRLNFLLYLNPDWQESWGGHLELWDKDMQGPPIRVLPKLNRCVIFTTTATSYHGHPHALECPEGIHRKSIALYYFTNGRPEGEGEPTSATTWRDIPEAYRREPKA